MVDIQAKLKEIGPLWKDRMITSWSADAKKSQRTDPKSSTRRYFYIGRDAQISPFRNGIMSGTDLRKISKRNHCK